MKIIAFDIGGHQKGIKMLWILIISMLLLHIVLMDHQSAKKPVYRDYRDYPNVMQSYGEGKYCVQANNILEGQAIVKCLREADERQNRIAVLRKINFGHYFQPWNRRCSCGMSDIDFRMLERPWEGLTLCRDAMKNYELKNGEWKVRSVS